MKRNDSRVLIFVGGVHGVGKSTLCKQICAELGVEYLLASELINLYRSRKVRSQSQDDKDKRVKEIDNNQEALVVELNQRIIPGKRYLLDGHFTLLDTKEKIQLIPVYTFVQIAPCAIIVLTDDPNAIQKRLIARDNKKYEKELLVSMQEQELIHARRVGSKVGVTVYEFTPNDINRLKAVISTLGKDGWLENSPL